MSRLDGYVAEMEYVNNFYRELGPSVLNLVLTIQGIEPIPLNNGFACCDLGCGQGYSTNLIAACHPDGQFHGIDFNHAHIAGARSLAAQARLENVVFWEASFEELRTLDLPDFDFITLHGVYSWVSSENRSHIVDFIRTKLKVGGVVYVSYNCLPGWSSLAPIRQLLISCIDMETDLLEEQIKDSINFVERLRSMSLSYFNQNPSSGFFFDAISKLSRNYLAHEYYNEFWVQFYHADVVKELVAAKISFAGSASFVDNFDFLMFSDEEQQLLLEINNPVQKETIKDFAVNKQFRRDVFTSGRKRLDRSVHLELISRCHFALVVPRNKQSITLNFPRGDAQFDPELYESVLLALDVQNHSLDELLQKPTIARFGSEKILQTLMVLLSAGYLMPAVIPSPQNLASSMLFNYTILERMAFHIEPLYLASPVIQSGIPLDWVQRLMLLCEVTDSGDPFTFISGMMLELNYALIKDDVVLQSWDENLEELGQQIRLFHASELPLLKRLGVV